LIGFAEVATLIGFAEVATSIGSAESLTATGHVRTRGCPYREISSRS
jgi:hypothetical protein